MDYTVNYLALLASGIIGVAIGWIWYSPMVFGKQWMGAIGIDDSPEMRKEGMKSMPRAIVGSFAAQIVLAFVFTYFAQALGIANSIGAVQLGLWAWIGFVATTSLHPVLWERRPLVYYAVNAGYNLAMFVVIALIVVLWK
jgi:hypothetical protein